MIWGDGFVSFAVNQPQASSDPNEMVAAVDLGSNSFHMVVARNVDGQVHIVDRLRERVALAESLDADKNISREGRDRALTTLSLFGQRLAHMPKGTVRAVGTNTLRQAKNGRSFLEEAEQVLGHPIEVISGREEARLVYLGVAHTVEDRDARRLVIDIGGGSTECIIGEGLEPLEADSLYMGCVTFERFFPKGQIKQRFFDDAETAAALELAPIVPRYTSLGWSQVIGSSGTITSVEQILRAEGWSPGGITLKGLKRLKKELIEFGSASAIKLAGMPSDRAPVLASGVAILLTAFEQLGFERMQASDGALREGLVYDLVGRIYDRDVRDRTIAAMCSRYRVDDDQAQRVESTALRLLDMVSETWDLQPPFLRRVLSWAARLHEVGKAISYSGYHKHGAYIVRHSDMPGFSREDQHVLAELVHAHRRKLRASWFEALPVDRPERYLRLAILLRLAVVLNRSRARRAVPNVRVTPKKRALELSFPNGWLTENPLTLADLQQEADHLRTAGFDLDLGTPPAA
jgi:exopolyphosphatase/guanosine-5'-triphosphate,3'-diphosphate pyrophosphatase